VLINLGTEPFALIRGERIAQFLLASVPDWNWRLEADGAALGATRRGAGGYGSTGKG